MAEVLIIGYGNPLRGDDGAGWEAAGILKERIRDKRVEVVRSHQLMPEMAEAISRARKVIFIDADCDNKEGQIAFRKVVPEHSSEVCTHHLTPGVLLGAAGMLYGGCAEGMLVTMGAGSFEYGSELSEAVRTALPSLVERVQEMCGEWLSAAGNSYHL